MSTEDTSLRLSTILICILALAVIAGAVTVFYSILNVPAIHETNVETTGAIESISVNNADVSTNRHTVTKFTVTVLQGDTNRVEIYRLTDDGKTIVGKTGVLKEEKSVTIRSNPPRFGDYKAVAKKNGTVVGTAHFEVKEGQADNESPQ